ncbi:aldehyde dehydrogenase family protein [Dickeya undicola]|uniref:aldehyde dehydrogenase family protein n=1 Tax=Dickeya undicola TaxID=1577887 RepID=UPI003F264281
MLSFNPDNVRLPLGHFIDGQHRRAQGQTLIVKRPSDGKPYAELYEADASLVDEAVMRAEQASVQSGWRTCPPRQRGAVLRRWADLIEADADYLGQLEALGSTRPISDVRQHEIPFTADAIRFYAECADKFGGEVLPTRESSLGLLVPEPYGVIAAITPWNFPLSMASWKCGPALAAGNAVVLKPSELTPLSTVRMAELALEAGLPPGVLNIVQGTGAVTGAALVSHPLVRKVSFTGSTQTGARIMSDAACHGMKPVTLELGGKSPQLVFDDAGDPATVAARILRGFTANGGQACVAGTRLIVQRGIADALLSHLINGCRAMRPGVTWQEESRYSPLIDERQSHKVASLVAAAQAAGGEILVGGERFADTGDGHFWQPTLITGVKTDNPAVREEIFGPVLTVQYFDDEDEGLALAAHPTYGLCAGVHTLNIERALRAMRGIAAGTVWINRYGRSGDFIIPTGGFQGSGIGKDLGRQAFESCHRYKSVLIDF